MILSIDAKKAFDKFPKTYEEEKIVSSTNVTEKAG
jgi:hypothetical protein